MTERRRKVWGLTPGNWIAIASSSCATLAIIVGAFFTQYDVWSQTLRQVNSNATNISTEEEERKKAIFEVRSDFAFEMEKVEDRLNSKINATRDIITSQMEKMEKRAETRDQETRRDIKEILRALK